MFPHSPITTDFGPIISRHFWFQGRPRSPHPPPDSLPPYTSARQRGWSESLASRDLAQCFDRENDGRSDHGFTAGNPWLYPWNPQEKGRTRSSSLAHPWESSAAHPMDHHVPNFTVECRQETKSNGSIMDVVQQSLHQFFLWESPSCSTGSTLRWILRFMDTYGRYDMKGLNNYVYIYKYISLYINTYTVY